MHPDRCVALCTGTGGLSLPGLGDLLHCRAGSKRVALRHSSYRPPPNRACGFQRTRLFSVSFHLLLYLDDTKYRFDFLHYACLSGFVSDTPASLRHVRGFLSRTTMETPLPYASRHVGNHGFRNESLQSIP